MSISRIGLNFTTTHSGGGLKNAVSLIKHTFNQSLPNIRFFYYVSQSVNDSIDSHAIDNTYSWNIFSNPSRSLSARRKLEGQIYKDKIDLLYSMNGPAYIESPAKHVLGISNPGIIYASFKDLCFGVSLPTAIFKYFRLALKKFAATKADHFFLQTATSRSLFCERFRISPNLTSVVPNACDHFYQNYSKQKNDIIQSKSLGRLEHLRSQNNAKIIFFPAASYPHKGFKYLVPIVESLLQGNYLDYKLYFILTVPHESCEYLKLIRALSPESKQYIVNIGPYRNKFLPFIMRSVDYVFVPSQLEIFSASYLEAFLFKKPLIVSDKFLHMIFVVMLLFILILRNPNLLFLL